MLMCWLSKKIYLLSTNNFYHDSPSPHILSRIYLLQSLTTIQESLLICHTGRYSSIFLEEGAYSTWEIRAESKLASMMLPRIWKVSYLIHLFIILTTTECYFGHISIPNLPNKRYRREGDFNIGALLPAHGYEMAKVPNSNGRLEKVFTINGFSLLQRLEAIAYAVDEINNRNDLLPNFTLGYVIFDDMYSESKALAQSLRFIQNQSVCERNGTNSCRTEIEPVLERFSITAMLAGEGSITTAQVSNLFTSFNIPQLSYLATSNRLKVKERQHLFKTIPGDQYQAEAIVALMNHYEWKYASIVYSAGLYGSEGYKEIVRAADKFSFCFGIIREIRDNWTIRDYQDLIFELMLDRNSTAVVAFTNLAHARILISVSNILKAEGRITWIATDAWARELTDLSGLLLSNFVGAFSVKVDSINPPRFYKRFRELTPKKNQEKNPWINEYLEKYFECTYPENQVSPFETCNPDLNISNHVHNPRERTVSLVYDSVYAIAHSLQDALNSSVCRGLSDRQKLKDCATSNLRTHLKDVEFMGETQVVKFDQTTNAVRRDYKIFNIQNKTGEWKMVHVASYATQNKVLIWEKADVQWSRGIQPSSSCNQECSIGYAQRVTDRPCCWTCFPCPPHNVVGSDVLAGGKVTKKCVECLPGTWPDKRSRTKCMSIEPTFLKWHEPLGVIICSLSATGLAACFIILSMYIMNCKHQHIKASSRELSIFLMLSLMIGYAFCFCLIIKPTAEICMIRQVGICLCFTLFYAPIATKTSRIYRIFEAGVKMKRKPKCTSSKSQIGIVFVLVFAHIILITAFVCSMPPAVELETALGINKVTLTCTRDTRVYAISFTYNGLLLVAAMYCAFKTRKLPDSFNEARFLTFCIYSTLVVWLAFFPAYLAIPTNEFQIVLLSSAVLINATLILGCMFIPKLVAVYLLAAQPKDPDARFKMLAECRRKSKLPRAVQPEIQANENPPNSKRIKNNSLSPKETSTCQCLAGQCCATAAVAIPPKSPKDTNTSVL